MEPPWHHQGGAGSSAPLPAARPNPAPQHALTQEGSSPHTSTRTHSQLSPLIPGAVRSPPGLAKTPLSLTRTLTSHLSDLPTCTLGHCQDFSFDLALPPDHGSLLLSRLHGEL